MTEPILPNRFQPGIARYFSAGIKPGNFLWAVLCNDLMKAVTRADPGSIHELPGLVAWLVDNAPAADWGSEERCEAHLRRMSHERQR